MAGVYVDVYVDVYGSHIGSCCGSGGYYGVFFMHICNFVSRNFHN